MPDERDAAHAHLLAAGGALAALAARQGPVDPYTWPGIPQSNPTHPDRLGGLALHITAQQISVVAALVIWGRLLTALRGVGPWSAQMFLLHEVCRPDVFPAADIGLRTALGRLDGLAVTPSTREAAATAIPWSPYRSYAAAQLWRSL